MAGWVEFYLLRRSMNLRIGRTGIAATHLIRLWSAALLAAGAGWALLQVVQEWAPVPRACLVLSAFAAAYLGITALLGVDEVRDVAARFRRMTRRGT